MFRGRPHQNVAGTSSLSISLERTERRDRPIRKSTMVKRPVPVNGTLWSVAPLPPKVATELAKAQTSQVLNAAGS